MTDRKERTEAFRKQGWGVFTHYIGFRPTEGELRSGYKPFKTWDDRVNAFNTDTYAKTLHDIGARYAFFTVMQGDKYMCAPNAAFDKICGTRPGEACSTRDLIGDLIQSLKKYGIPLYLYYTGDGPYMDEACGRRMGYCDRETEYLTDAFVENWTSVMKEYAVRYGKDIHGWWIDGCFKYFGYGCDKWFQMYREAALAGNPDAIIAFNNGVSQPDTARPSVLKYTQDIEHPMAKVRALERAAETDPEALRALSYQPGNSYRYSEYEDYTAGECDAFDELPPEGGMVDGSRWHKLGFLGQYACYTEAWGGGGWNCLGSRYTGEEIRRYVKEANRRGGVVTIDAYLFDDGSFDKAQLEVLKQIEK